MPKVEQSYYSIHSFFNEDFYWFPNIVSFDDNRVLLPIICILRNKIELREDLFSAILTVNSVSEQAVRLLKEEPNLQNLLVEYGLDDKSTLSYGTTSYGANKSPYSVKNIELTYKKDVLGKIVESESSFLKRVGLIIENENSDYVSGVMDTKHIELVITQTVTELNNWKYPAKRADAWNIMYGLQITNIRDEINNSSNKNDAPWCYYNILLKVEDPTHKLSLKDKELLKGLAESFDKTSGTYRSLIYKAIYIINYIKCKQGIDSSPVEPYDYSMDDIDPIITDVLEFVKPIFNSKFINTKVLSVNAFIAIFKLTLKFPEVYSRLGEYTTTSRNLGKNFNVPLLGNILGCLLDVRVESHYNSGTEYRMFTNVANANVLTKTILGKDNKTMRTSMTSKYQFELSKDVVEYAKGVAQTIYDAYLENRRKS